MVVMFNKFNYWDMTKNCASDIVVFPERSTGNTNMEKCALLISPTLPVIHLHCWQQMDDYLIMKL